jgi:hypothetical protein
LATGLAPPLSNCSDQRTDLSRTNVSIVVVEFPTRLRGKKAVGEAALHYFVNEGTKDVDEVVWRICTVRVHCQRVEEACHGLVELTLP